MRLNAEVHCMFDNQYNNIPFLRQNITLSIQNSGYPEGLCYLIANYALTLIGTRVAIFKKLMVSVMPFDIMRETN